MCSYVILFSHEILLFFKFRNCQIINMKFIHFFKMYSWDGKSIFMRNMLVKSTHRLKGVGKIIFQELMKHATETGCHRIEFLVPEWNPAKEFYKKMGAINYTVRTGYEYYRVNQESIDQCGCMEE